MEDNIRPPDDIKKDRLIEETPDEDTQFNIILQMSKAEFIKKQYIEEQEIKTFLEYEKKKHITKFKTIQEKINKLLIFDTENTSKYELILNVIELYNQEYITKYEMDQKEHNNIVSIIKSIRLTKEELTNLLSLLVVRN